VPNDFPVTILEVGGSILIPSGIKVRLPKGYALIAFNKSGIATKRGLDIGACVIDSDYLGEIHIHLTKTSRAKDMENEMNKAGDKIAQFILVPIALPEAVEITNDEYENLGPTQRNAGGFGSTDV
jgi:dUTP pyrophosphatase